MGFLKGVSLQGVPSKGPLKAVSLKGVPSRRCFLKRCFIRGFFEASSLELVPLTQVPSKRLAVRGAQLLLEGVPFKENPFK